MIQIRKASERGHFNHGWLDTYHTFSFADYYDPNFMGFRDLRVINEDRVAAGRGFPTHPHRDMEIITYILSGALQHQDSMGTGSVILPGDVQRMSAGTGVTHSEYNHSKHEAVHLLQIWILPREKNLPPSYEQKSYPEERKRNQWLLIASSDGSEGSVLVHQDVRLLTTLLGKGQVLGYSLDPKRSAWVQVARGELELNGETLRESDGAALHGESELSFQAKKDSEILLFDLN